RFRDPDRFQCPLRPRRPGGDRRRRGRAPLRRSAQPRAAAPAGQGALPVRDHARAGGNVLARAPPGLELKRLQLKNHRNYRGFDLPGHFRVTLFWPDDLGLVKAGPDLRRRFLNQMLVQVEPGYARALGRLRRVLEQRNTLLKRIAAGEDSADLLEPWNLELVE